MLIPNIKQISTDKHFVPQEEITDMNILYKKLLIDDVSIFINTKDTYRPLRE